MRPQPRARVEADMRTSVMLRALVLALCLGLTTAKASPGVCVNQQGVPPFALAGKPPAKGKGLTFCEEYRGETCCDAKTTDNVRRVAAHMQLGGFKIQCREAWTQLECSICDPRAGIMSKTKVCAHQCDAIYRACKDDYFTEDKLQRLTPCRSSDTICTKLSDWADDMGGGQMCEDAGYEVVSAGKSKADGGWCFDGPNVPKAGASQRSSAQKKDRSRRKGKGGSAGEIAKSGFYLVVAAVLVLGYYAMRAYAGNRRGGSHSTARMAARMAAEARAQRANAYAKASHYL